MTTVSSDELLAQAMTLPDDERARLARDLLASFDGPADDDAERAWADEIRRRIADVESGRADLVDWADARKRIAHKLGK